MAVYLKNKQRPDEILKTNEAIGKELLKTNRYYLTSKEEFKKENERWLNEFRLVQWQYQMDQIK